jgi:hypothetical protein
MLRAITNQQSEVDMSGSTTDITALADLLRETAEHHDPYEKAHAPHNWWDWYAAYMNARGQGDAPDEASRTAGRYMEERNDAHNRQ